MHGYLRRKATYNLGKAGKQSKPPKAKHRGKGRVSGNSPFNWFNAEPETHPVRYEIQDTNGMFKADKEYIEMGEREGWLRQYSYYIDHNDYYVYIYYYVG